MRLPPSWEILGADTAGAGERKHGDVGNYRQVHLRQSGSQQTVPIA
jgi:hypothetical protein